MSEFRGSSLTIDRKFQILAVNPCNGHIYTEKNAVLLCAKDKAVPAALVAYHNECIKIGCAKEHIDSIRLLIERINHFQELAGARIPDTVGECEINRCLYGEGVE